MKPNTLTRLEYKVKIYVKNIINNSCRIRNQLKSRIRIRKKHCLSATKRILIHKNPRRKTLSDSFFRWSGDLLIYSYGSPLIIGTYYDNYFRSLVSLWLLFLFIFLLLAQCAIVRQNTDTIHLFL